ncbi:MAG: hypothetical protein JST27_06850 [Bacteroidetes bacterium]|nr:hypothetical protein [Bacteroidota bacterium]
MKSVSIPKVWSTIASILYVLSFFILHHYVTNAVVAQSNYNYVVLSNAVQYFLAALLFKRLFNSQRLMINGIILFCSSIFVTILVAWYISRDEGNGLLFPQFVPFYLCINLSIIWLVFKNKFNKILTVIASVIILACILLAELLIMPKSAIAENEHSAASFVGLTVQPRRYLGLQGDTLTLPNPKAKRTVFFISFIECIPCRHMQPFANEMNSKFCTPEIVFYKVNPVDGLIRIKKYENSKGNKADISTIIPMYIDSFKRQIPFHGLPLTLILDESGKIIYAHIGYNPQEKNLLLSRFKYFLNTK